MATDIALALAKCTLKPLSVLAVQVFEDISNFQENIALLKTAYKRLESLNDDIHSQFEDAQPPKTITEWFDRVKDSLKTAQELVSESQQRGHDGLLCLGKPNLSNKMRKWRAGFRDLLEELPESLSLIQLSCQIKLRSMAHKESGSVGCGEVESESVKWGGAQVETKTIEDQSYSLYIDISYGKNSSCFAMAFVLYDDSDREVLKSTMIMSTEKPAQHNFYYHALIQGLRAARSYGVQKIVVVTKSKLLRDQMKGEAKADKLKDLHSSASNIAKEFLKFDIHGEEGKEFYVESKQLCSDLRLQYEYLLSKKS